MGVKPDHWICEMARNHRMIEPFEADQVKDNKISYGTSSYGYDFRLADVYKIPQPTRGPIDPKEGTGPLFSDYRGDSCLVEAGSFVLGRSLEYFRIPRDILTLCTGKSTYARCGLVVNVTPFEPEWEGFATLSISNTGSVPVKIYSGEGIAQLVFLKADGVCRTSYKDKKGKYQAQKDIVGAKVSQT